MNAISAAQPTSSSEVKALAEKARAATAAAPDMAQAFVLGDRFLKSVATQPQATATEKLVAATMRECTAHSLKYVTARKAQEVTLQALAAGVGGPAGQVLASLGKATSGGAFDQADQYLVAQPWLRAIQREGAPLDQVLAKMATDCTTTSLKYVTAIQVQSHALDAVAAGPCGAPEKVLADFGVAVMRGAFDMADQHKLALKILPTIAAVGKSPEGHEIASLAMEMLRHSMKYTTAVQAETKALETVAAGASGDLDVVRARFATAVMGTAAEVQDQYMLANVALARLRDKGQALPSAVARATMKATGQQLKYVSAVGLQARALHQVEAGGTGDPIDRTLAKLGLEAEKVAYDVVDRFKMVRALLGEIKAKAADPNVVALVDFAERVAQIRGITYQDAAQAQHEVLDHIVTGNTSMPAMPAVPAGSSPPMGSGSSPAVALPEVDEKAEPEAQIKSLEACLEKNRRMLGSLEEEGKDSARRLGEIGARQKEIADQVKALEEQKAPMCAKSRLLGRIGAVGGATGALGFAATMALHVSPPICLAIGAAGAVAAFAGTILKTRNDFKIGEKARQATDLAFEHQRLAISAQMLGTLDSGRASRIEHVEKVIRDQEKRLDVLRMATAPPAPERGDPGTVRVEEDFITVGGVRIPRNGSQKAADAQEVGVATEDEALPTQ